MNRSKSKENNRKRISRCADLLDQRVPGWEQKIDRRHLDLARSDKCVFGQIFGSYCLGIQKLGLGISKPQYLGVYERFGFVGFADEKYERLTEDWVEFLEEREKIAA